MTVVYRLPGAKLFGSGVYRGQQWTPAMIRKMAENAPRLAKLHCVPAVGIGHDSNDTAGAEGWIDPHSVRAVADPEHAGEALLTGDLVNVPPSVAEKVRNGSYAFGSAEIYSDFTDDMGRSHGPLLRRFVLLGSHPPQVKRLGRLPMPIEMASPVAFGERRLPAGRYVAMSFAERSVTAMSPKPAFDRDVVAVAKFAEHNRRGLRAMGKTPIGLVASFKHLRSAGRMSSVDLLGSAAEVHRFAEAPVDAAGAKALRDTVGGATALQSLQLSYYAGDLPRQAAISNAVNIFKITQSEAEAIFPEIAPDAPSSNVPSSPASSPASPAPDLSPAAVPTASSSASPAASARVASKPMLIGAIQSAMPGLSNATLSAMSLDSLVDLARNLALCLASQGPDPGMQAVAALAAPNGG